MNRLTSQVYRILVPKYIRNKILARQLPISIMNYYATLSEPISEEIEVVLNYLKTNPLTVFPYSFKDQYIADEIKVFDDTDKGLRYVWLDGKRLYFKKRWNKQKIRHLFNLLSQEQDLQSPHRYLNDRFTFESGEVLVDVGVAEGNFALSVVEKASKLILFEADKEWIEPLKATFEPWKDKVLIVNKYVGNITNATCTKLDDFFSEGENLTFLKIDVEGAESRLLDGCKRILSEVSPLKLAICTYHKQDDEKNFRSLLTQRGFETSHSDGFMLFYYDKKMKAPYFRRALLRATKTYAR